MAGITPEKKRIITLSSGASRGSNLLAIHRYFKLNGIPVEIHRAVFCSSKAEAIGKCREMNIPYKVLAGKDITQFEARLLALIAEAEISLVALCGYMRQISPAFLAKVNIPVLNIHPALLPKYGGKGMYGMAVHQAVFAAGEQYSGATVHTVDAIYDHGNIVSQCKVDISTCSSAEEIALKVLELEHQIYAPAIYERIKES